MTTRSARWFAAFVLVIALVTLGLRPSIAGADDPKGKADELPEGAKVRLGESRLVFRFSLSLSLLPPDYKALVLAEGDGKLRRVDVATGRPLDDRKEPVGGTYGNYPVVVSADGMRFVSTQVGALTVREAETGKVVKELKAVGGFNTAYVVSQPVASLSADGKVFAHGGTGMNNKSAVVVWDVEKGDILFQIGLPTGGPGIPLLSPDGKLVAVRGSGFGAPTPKAAPGETPKYTVTVFEVQTGKELLRAQATAGPSPLFGTAAFSPDGSALATAASDGLVELWDVKADKLKAQLLGRSGQGARLAFSPDGKTLAAVGTDGAIQRWAAGDGKPVGTTEGPAVQAVPQGLAFPDNERVIAWGMAGPCPVVWEAPSGKVLTPLPDHTGAIQSIAFAAGGKEVVTSGQDGRVFRWSAATGKRIGEVALRPSRNLTGGPPRLPVTVSPDGTRAVSTGTPAAVLDLATGAEEFALPRGLFGNYYYVSSIPSADATKLIVLSSPFDRARPGKCVVWDLVARQKMIDVELAITPGFPPSAAVSPSGKRLVTAAHTIDAPNGQPTLVVTGWDLKTGKKLGQVEDAKTRGSAFVAAADDEFAVVSSAAGRLQAIDYATGKVGEEFTAGKERGESLTGPVVFSADGKRFAAAGPGEQTNTYVVKVHEWPSGKVQHTFTGFRAPVSAMTFSPDGKTLATGSQDTTVLLWDVTEAK